MVLAIILAIATVAIFIGLFIRVIAAVAAIIGVLLLIGALAWLGFDELVLEPRRKEKAPD